MNNPIAEVFRSIRGANLSSQNTGLRQSFVDALARVASFQVAKQATAVSGGAFSVPLTMESVKGQLREASIGVRSMVPDLAANEFIVATLADKPDLGAITKMVVEFLQEPIES